MTKGVGNYVLWDIQRGCDGRPRVTSDIGRQHRERRTEYLHFTIHSQIIGAPFLRHGTDGLQATAHLKGEGGIDISVLAPGDKPTKRAVILLDDGSSLWLHLDIIEPPRLGATIRQTTIHQLVGTQGKEVNHINADETERELEGIDILPLPGDREREQGTQHLHGHGSLFGRLILHLEGAERIPGGDTIVDGIIEDSPNVAKMDGTSIHGRTPTLLGTKPRLEPGQPIFGDALEGERLGMRVKRKHLLNGHQVDITSSRRPAQRCIGAETSQEPIIDTSIRAKFSSHPILHLDNRKTKESIGSGQLHEDFGDTSHTLEQEAVCLLLVWAITDTPLSLRIPMGRQEADANREKSMGTLMTEIELQGSSLPLGDSTSVEIEMDINHNPTKLFARILHAFCNKEQQTAPKCNNQQKRRTTVKPMVLCGKRGIRTPESVSPVTRFPGVPLQPLEHLSLFG